MRFSGRGGCGYGVWPGCQGGARREADAASPIRMRALPVGCGGCALWDWDCCPSHNPPDILPTSRKREKHMQIEDNRQANEQTTALIISHTSMKVVGCRQFSSSRTHSDHIVTTPYCTHSSNIVNLRGI